MVVTVLVVTLIFAFFVYVTVRYAPSAEAFFILFLAWSIVPAFVASIILARYRMPIYSAISAGIVGMLILDYMFLRYGYFLPDPTPSFPTPNGQQKLLMASAYLIIGVALSSVCGAFTYIICKTIDRSHPVGNWTRIWIGTRKGFTYSLTCAILTLPVLYSLLPQNGRDFTPICIGYLIGGTFLGTMVGFLIGAAYPINSRTTIENIAG